MNEEKLGSFSMEVQKIVSPHAELPVEQINALLSLGSSVYEAGYSDCLIYEINNKKSLKEAEDDIATVFSPDGVDVIFSPDDEGVFEITEEHYLEVADRILKAIKAKKGNKKQIAELIEDWATTIGGEE